MTVGLFSPLTDELTPLPGFEGSLEQVSRLSGLVQSDGLSKGTVPQQATGLCDRDDSFTTQSLRGVMCWLQVLWDAEDPSLFVASNSRGQLYTYLLTQQSLSGQQLQLLATASLAVGHKPVLLADGRLSVRLKSGAVDTFVLDTHKPLLEHSSDVKQLQGR
jgi:hypothetical protein